MKPLFLNVDLEIESATKLDVLVAEMDKRVTVLHHGLGSKPQWHLLALETFRRHTNPDANILTFCSIIESFSPVAYKLWREARRKEFDVGYELRLPENFSRFTLRSETLERIAKLGAGLAVSYYRGISDQSELVPTTVPKLVRKKRG